MSTACLIFVSSLQTWYSDSFGNQLTSLTQCDVSVSSWDMIRVWRSPAFLNISVCCHIHCSIYLMLTIVTSWQEFLCLPCREMRCHAWHLALGLICFCKCFWWRFIGFCWLLFVSDPAGGIFYDRYMLIAFYGTLMTCTTINIARTFSSAVLSFFSLRLPFDLEATLKFLPLRLYIGLPFPR